MSKPKDEYTQQIAEEEYESLGEGARRDLLDFGSSEDTETEPPESSTGDSA